MLLSLVTWLWYVNSYLLSVFPVVLFLPSGKRIRTMILLYCVRLTYDRIRSLGMRLGLYMYTALRSFPYLRCYRSEFINNRTQSMGKTRGYAFPHPFTPPFCFRLVATAFENFEYPRDVQTHMILLLCFLNGFQVLFRVKQVVKNIT